MRAGGASSTSVTSPRASDSCDALLEAAFDQVATKAIAFGTELAAELADQGRSDPVELVLGLVRYVADSPGRRAVLLESQAMPALRARRATFVLAVAQVIEADAHERLGTNATAPDLRIPALVVTNGVLDTVATWIGGGLDVSLDELVTGLTATATLAMDGGAGAPGQADGSP